MEKYLFVKEGDRLVSIRVSEHFYTEILKWAKMVPVLRCENLGDEEGSSESPLTLTDEEKIKMNILAGESDSVFVKDKDYFRRIPFDTIRWIEASGSYCCLIFKSAPKLMLSFNLRELSVHLPPRLFIRVHRSYIVNLKYIDSFIGNMLCIGSERIPVSKQHKRNVIARLNILGNVK